MATPLRPLEYTSLDLDQGEIRLATLLPGQFDDVIRLRFQHLYLPVPDGELSSTNTARLQRARAILPEGWRAEYTLEGRLLYWATDGSASSWQHPQMEAPEDDTAVDMPPVSDVYYEALSYCWGPSEPEEIVYIDTDTPPFTMAIQPNLVRALRHLRYPDRPRTLWVDAICINQKDLGERGRHVARMGSLYALAPRVVAWLGPATATSDVALQTLASLGRQIEITPSGGYRAPGADHPEWYTQYPCTPATAAALRALFWDHAWWQRLWVWQEILLARCVPSDSDTDGDMGTGAMMQCGTCVVPWYLVRRGLRLLRETTLPAALRADLCPAPVWWLPHAVATTSTHDWDSLSYLLRSTRGCGCADARDRIYALLGLVPRRLATAIVPDYRAAPVDVFRDAFLAFLAVHRNLILLKFCTANVNDQSAPSWVPRWQTGVVVTPQQARAAGSSAAHAECIAPGQLAVRGIEAARVAACSDASWRQTDTAVTPAAAWQTITAWHTLWQQHHADATDAVDFFTTIRFGWVGERRAIGTTARAYADEFDQVAALGAAATDADQTHGHLVEDMLRDEKDCTFFSTADGLSGMGPVDMQPGDTVAVLLGCPHPMVLRRVDSSFRVVGPAYVNGLMEAQALLGPLPAPWRVRIDWSTGKERWLSYNPETEALVADVRLAPLPRGWMQAADGTLTDEHGAVQTEDPRETLEAVTARGVDVGTFVLV